MDVKKRKFGLLSDGSKVYLYKVSNGDMSFCVTNYGCVITSIRVPSKSGTVDDVVLAPETLDALVRSDAAFGACVGRFANRIGGASFSLDGQTYHLDKNDGNNCLHGGFFRWEKQIWKAKVIRNFSEVGVCFKRISPDGEQGMPGNLKIEVTYVLTNKNELCITYKAKTDKTTIVNFTNHSYFNLKGHSKGDVLSHVLKLDCDTYLESEGMIPTGRILPVDGTVFDFRQGKAIGTDISASELWATKGYDHCYCIDSAKKNKIFAEVREPVTGRIMTVTTDMPGVQFYTGNWLQGSCGKNGITYRDQSGFCLETQNYPDAPNKDFPCCVLKPGEEFNSKTVYTFAW